MWHIQDSFSSFITLYHFIFLFQIDFCVSASTSAIYFLRETLWEGPGSRASQDAACFVPANREIFSFPPATLRFNTFWKNPFIKAIQAEAFDTLLIPALPDIAICHFSSQNVASQNSAEQPEGKQEWWRNIGN